MNGLKLEELTGKSMKHRALDNKSGLLVPMVGCFLRNLDKIENGEESKKREFHEKGN